MRAADVAAGLIGAVIKDPVQDRVVWLEYLETVIKERAGWQKAVVALANKNARILWAVLTRDASFDPDHVPEVPAARCSPKLQTAT